MSKKSRNRPKNHPGWVRTRCEARDVFYPVDRIKLAEERIIRTRSKFWIGQHTTGYGPFLSWEAAEAAWVIMYGT